VPLRQVGAIVTKKAGILCLKFLRVRRSFSRKLHGRKVLCSMRSQRWRFWFPSHVENKV
jgi:hypothetical protein